MIYCILVLYFIIDFVQFRAMLEKVANVTIDDMKRVGKQYVAAMFDSSQSRTVVCCNPSKVSELTKEFKE